MVVQNPLPSFLFKVYNRAVFRAFLDSCERDRIKVDVAPEMPGEGRGLKTFTELDPEFNELNDKGFPVSFKQNLCSLQLSFAKTSVNGLWPRTLILIC